MSNNRMSQIACFAFFVLLMPCILKGEEVSAKPNLAPGSLITILPDIDYEMASNRADMEEILARLPEIDPELADDVRFNKEFWAKQVRYQRDIWCLQFSFKPIRVIYVDIPNKEGSFDKKAVWYLVYNVKNLGPIEWKETVKERTVQADGVTRTIEEIEYAITKPGSSIGTEVDREVTMPVARDTVAVSEFDESSVEQKRDAALVLQNLPGTFKPRRGTEEPLPFEPQFILATDRLTLDTVSVNDPETGKVKAVTETTAVSYVDQAIPLAIPLIMKREGMKAIPETTVSFAEVPIEGEADDSNGQDKRLAPGQDRWGVATWTDIDPRISRFSVYISGLTNAYRWVDDGSNTGKPGEGRSMKRRVLKTNWWRIGDRFHLDDSQIRYGQPGELDFEWTFL